MATGCFFVKMRAIRSRFGEQTQASIASTEAHLLSQYTQFFKAAAKSGEWKSQMPAELTAGYLNDQLGLAASQRANKKASELVRTWSGLALSALL